MYMIMIERSLKRHKQVQPILITIHLVLGKGNNFIDGLFSQTYFSGYRGFRR